MKVAYCTGHERSSPHWCRIRSRSSGRALASAMSATGSPVSRTIRKIVALRMKSVTTLYRMRRMMNCDMQRRLVLHLDVFPGIRVAGGDGRKDILPLLEHHPSADRGHEPLEEHGHEEGVFQK